MYLKMEAPIVQTSWLKLSMPILHESFMIIQEIECGQNNEEFNLIQNLNFGVKITTLFLSLYSFSMVFIFFLTFMRKLLAKNAVPKPKFSPQKIVSVFLRTAERISSTSTSMNIFILLFNLYLWLFMLMVINTTKTNKVVSVSLDSGSSFINKKWLYQVINTDNIIKNVDDALNTPRTFCLVEDETEFKVLSK